MKKYLLALFFLLPSVTFASGLTTNQINAVLGVLRAFSVPEAEVQHIADLLNPTAAVAPQTAPQQDPLQITSMDIVRPDVTLPASYGAHIHFTTNKPPYSWVNIYQNGALVGNYYPIVQYSEDVHIHVPNLNTALEYTYLITVENGGESTTTTGSFQI